MKAGQATAIYQRTGTQVQMKFIKETTTSNLHHILVVYPYLLPG